MAPPVHQESGIMPMDTLVEEEMELEQEKDLLFKHKRPKFEGSIVQPQQEIEDPAVEKENKGPGVLPPELPLGNKPMVGVTSFVVPSTGEANGCSVGHVRGCRSNEPAARSRLNSILRETGWKDPMYDFEEQGPPHAKLFTCKVTVHVEAITNTVVECFSEPRRQKKVAQEHAAQGALWWLERFGRVK